MSLTLQFTEFQMRDALIAFARERGMVGEHELEQYRNIELEVKVTTASSEIECNLVCEEK